eukprot:TRINITY_DN59057_c0_g1_i1.p1 TRINITY_DN59057_c0_g1~~TRINITY_DN59057_c0_g1_i1.p1  ORF type:complete len:649 (+),score=-43.50 TRINITY_DN59057_c0_g1_i1:57-2003(+)
MSDAEVDKDKDDPDNKKLVHEGWDSLTEKKRGCTDCPCLLLLMAVWFAMTIVGFIATGVIENDNLKAGNPARLINPIDYRGRICGFSDGVKSKPIGYYFPDTTVVCIKSCPNANDYSKFICRNNTLVSDANADQTVGYTYVNGGNCFFELASSNVMNRCLLDNKFSVVMSEADAASPGGVTLASFSSYPDSPYSSSQADFINKFIADVYNYADYIFGFGLGVSTVIAFLYLYFLRLPGILSLLIWGILISVDLFLLAGAWMLWGLADTWKNDGEHTDAEYQTMKVFSYIVMALFLLYTCLILVMGKRIAMAVSIVKEAARALAAMPILILSPVFQMLGMVIFLVPWTIYVLYLASSGDMVIDKQTKFRTFEYDQNTKYAFWYMLFCWFWTSEFLIACGQLILALSIACWYFTRDKSKIGNSTVTWAFRVLTFNHLGTAAFGSLVIAIILTIRAIIAYIQRKAKKSGNKLLQYIMCCLQCCMWCLEKCMRFLNKNAYIQTAIYGYSFCKAARSAFFLLLRNILRVAAVNMVAEFVLLLGKVFVSVLTTFALYCIFAYSLPSEQMNGLIAPLFFTFLLAYFVSKMFSEVFGMGIETILLCFIGDEEMFPVEKRFADGGLASSLQKTAQAAAATKVIPVAEKEPEKKEVLM